MAGSFSADIGGYVAGSVSEDIEDIGDVELEPHVEAAEHQKNIPASDPNGRFATSVDSHLLGLLGLLNLLGLLGLFDCQDLLGFSSLRTS